MCLRKTILKRVGIILWRIMKVVGEPEGYPKIRSLECFESGIFRGLNGEGLQYLLRYVTMI